LGWFRIDSIRLQSYGIPRKNYVTAFRFSAKKKCVTAKSWVTKLLGKERKQTPREEKIAEQNYKRTERKSPEQKFRTQFSCERKKPQKKSKIERTTTIFGVSCIEKCEGGDLLRPKQGGKRL
jgi:hypothetical protein